LCVPDFKRPFTVILVSDVKVYWQVKAITNKLISNVLKISISFELILFLCYLCVPDFKRPFTVILVSDVKVYWQVRMQAPVHRNHSFVVS